MLKSGLALLAAAIVLCGCNSSSSNGSGSASGSGGSGEKTKLVFIPKNTGNPYFDPIIANFKTAAQPLNINFDVQGPATADPTSQLPIIKDQVQQGVDVIAISSNSPDALDEALDQARSKGITVVTVDSDLTGNETHRDVGILSTDLSKVGPGQIELLGSMINYQGEFAILSATSDAPNQNAWIATMKTALKDPKYSKMKLVDIVYGNDEPQKSSTEMEALLTKYPDLRGVIAPTTVGIASAAQILENSGRYPGGPQAKSGGVVLTGLGTPNQMKKAVQKGVVAKFQLWDSSAMGSIAATVGSMIHNKKLDPKPGATVDVTGVGKLTIEDKNVIYASPIITFDKSNIDKYNF
jgi:rhamnose transport system substrate-binding protein